MDELVQRYFMAFKRSGSGRAARLVSYPALRVVSALKGLLTGPRVNFNIGCLAVCFGKNTAGIIGKTVSRGCQYLERVLVHSGETGTAPATVIGFARILHEGGQVIRTFSHPVTACRYEHFGGRIQFVLFGFMNNLAAHLERSPLIHS